MGEKGYYSGPLHCLTATNRFAVLNVIMLVVLIPFCFAPKTIGDIVIHYMFFEAISILLLFSGLCCRNRCLLLFYLMLSAFTLFVTAFVIIGVFIAACSGGTGISEWIQAEIRPQRRNYYGIDEDLRSLIQYIAYTAFIFMASRFLLQCWCFNVVCRCFKYLGYEKHRLKTGLAARDAPAPHSSI